MENKLTKEDLKDVQDEIKRTTDIESAIQSEGGQIIMKSLKSDIVSAINELCSSYKTATPTELVALAARLRERFVLYQGLNGITKAKEMAIKDLEDILKEPL
jgi:hypothetical protein